MQTTTDIHRKAALERKNREQNYKATPEEIAAEQKKNNEKFNKEKNTPEFLQAQLFEAIKGKLFKIDQDAVPKGKYTIEQALDYGAAINSLNLTGKLALNEAIRDGNIEVVSYLLSKGADPTISDKFQQQNAYMVAVEGDSENLLEVLYKENKNINATANNNVTPLQYAIIKNKLEIVRKILSYKPLIEKEDNLRGDAALHYAAKEGLDTIVSLLIDDHQAKIDHTNKDGETALHLACARGYKDVVENLFRKGADVNLKNKAGYTPLMIAVIYNKIDVVKYLLSEKVNLTIKDNDKKSALDHAIEKNFINIENLIKDHSKKIEEEDNKKEIKSFANVSSQNSASQNEIEFIKKYITKAFFKNKNLSDFNEHGTTVLHLAAAFCYMEALKQLVEDEDIKIDINLKDKEGNTAVQAAIYGTYYLKWANAVSENDIEQKLVPVGYMNSLKALEYLLQKDANIYIANDSGEMPIHGALMVSNTLAIEDILRKDPAAVNAKGANQFSIIHYAVTSYKYDLLKLLHDDYKASLNEVDIYGIRAVDYANHILSSQKNLSLDKKDNLKKSLKYFFDNDIFCQNSKIEFPIDLFPYDILSRIKPEMQVSKKVDLAECDAIEYFYTTITGSWNEDYFC